jgi:hypothetical protein
VGSQREKIPGFFKFQWDPSGKKRDPSGKKFWDFFKSRWDPSGIPAGKNVGIFKS